MATNDGIEVVVLGPVEVLEGGAAVPLGGRLQRALLADLALNAGRVVSVAQLIDDLWGDEAPPSADHTLATYISRLRRILREGSAAQALATRSPGYLLDIPPEHVDAHRFANLVTRADDAVAGGKHADAASLLAEALETWRGAALSDIADVPFAAGVAQRLESERLLALEKRIDADLHLGRHRDVVAELEALTRAHPYREAFHAQLMQALYRSGRQADALAAYQTARRLLRDELGIDPDPELARLERAILNQDAELASTRPASDPMAVSAAGDVATTFAHRRRLRFLGLAVACAVAAGTALPLALGHPSAHAVAPPNGVGILTGDGRSLTAGFSLPAAPSQLAVGGGAMWLTSSESNTVYRLDLRSHSVTDRIGVGDSPEGVLYADGDVWVANVLDGTISRISTATDRVVQTVGLGSSPAGIAVGYGRIWVTDPVADTVTALDPTSGRIVKTIDVPQSPFGIAVGAGSVWVTDPAENTVSQLDARTGKTTQSIRVGAEPGAVLFAFDGVWVANRADSTVSRIDPSLDAVDRTVAVAEGPATLAAATNGVWVAGGAPGTVQRLDPQDGHVASSTKVGNRPVSVAVVVDRPWVALASMPSERHRGGTLHVLSQLPYEPDPAAGDQSPTLMDVMWDSLVTIQRTNSTAGYQIVPDLAVAIPTPSDGARTYSFTVRSGIRYSNGAPVRAEDFTFALVRLLRLNPYYRSVFTHVIGAADCTAVRCDLSRGVVADDRRGSVTFHLDAPDAQLLYHLSDPSTTPLPSSVGLHLSGTGGVPTTGPYKIGLYRPGKELDLVRNPMFHEWSLAAQPQGYPDAIDWTFGMTPAKEAREVEAGHADWAADQVPRVATIEATHPALLHVNPVTGIAFAGFNVRMAPFNDRRVRRAVSYAADRARAVAALGGPDAATPTCQIIPPGLPGYRPYCPFTVDPGTGKWVGPDLRTARRLIDRSGTRGMRVTVWGNTPARPLAQFLTGLLDKLGYRTRLRIAPDAVISRRATNSRLGIQATTSEWIDSEAASFFESFLSCSSFVLDDPADTHTNEFYCRPHIDKLTKRADALQATDPSASAALWSRIDRAVTNDAPWVPLASLKFADIISARCGHYIDNPVFGLLVDQLWVR